MRAEDWHELETLISDLKIELAWIHTERKRRRRPRLYAVKERIGKGQLGALVLLKNRLLKLPVEETIE